MKFISIFEIHKEILSTFIPINKSSLLVDYCEFNYLHIFLYMGIISNGNSENVAHVCRKLGILKRK